MYTINYFFLNAYVKQQYLPDNIKNEYLLTNYTLDNKKIKNG